MLCAVLIGRQPERETLETALHQAGEGQGRLLVLAGEAGVGKSRLAREAASDARRAGMAVMWGRATPGGGPFRAIAEAVLSWGRGRSPSGATEFVPFQSARGRLNAGDQASEHEPTAVLAESVVRAIRAAAAATGCLVVLEDLHWADGDTLAVVDYLADAVGDERIVCVATLRDAEPSPALDLVHALHGRRAAHVLQLGRLSARDVEDMARACLQTEKIDVELATYLAGVADGLPFLVEELLATLAETDALVEDRGHWHVRGGLGPQVPASFAATVRSRMSGLDDLARRALSAGAMLGRRFSWPLVAELVAADPTDLLSSLRSAVAAQLLEPTEEAEWFVFRHALTRDAVVGELLPGERAVLAGRAAAAIEAAHPGMAAEWCGLGAELWAAAGNRVRAAELFVQVGRHALSIGALQTAEAAITRASDLDVEGGLATERDDILLHVLSLAGRTDEAFEVGDRLLSHLAADGSDDQSAAEAHVRLARAAIAGNRWSEAEEHLEQIRRCVAVLDTATQVRVDALSAHVAFGLGRLDEAESQAAVAEQAALAAGLPEVACEALEIVGRCARERGSATAEEVFMRAAVIAQDAGLFVWRLRALHELGTIDLFDRADTTRLAEARDLARANGLLVTAANLELHIAACLSVKLEADAALAAARRCSQLARRCRLPLLAALGYGFEGNAHALLGQIDDMEDAIARALEAGGDNPQVAATCWGSCRGEAAAVAEDRPAMVEGIQKAMRLLIDAGQFTPAPLWGLWCLLAAIDGFDDEGAADHPGPQVHRVVRGMVQLAGAVRLGRAGQSAEAEAAFALGDAELTYLPWRRHYARRLVAPSALADGWGAPGDWAGDALGFFTDRGDARLAAACRSLLQAAGRRVPRRGRGVTPVPSTLRSAGVTSREADVLVLIGQGLTNGQIAERLCLSRRTVEFHVSNLLSKTAAADRLALAKVAITIGLA